MQKIISKFPMSRALLLLTLLTVIGLRLAYMQIYANPNASFFNSSPPIWESVEKINKADIVVFDKENHLHLIGHQVERKRISINTYTENMISNSFWVENEYQDSKYTLGSIMLIGSRYFQPDEVAFSSDDKFLLGSDYEGIIVYDIEKQKERFSKKMKNINVSYIGKNIDNVEYKPLGLIGNKIILLYMSNAYMATGSAVVHPAIMFLDMETGLVTNKKEIPFPATEHIDNIVWSATKKQFFVITSTRTPIPPAKNIPNGAVSITTPAQLIIYDIALKPIRKIQIDKPAKRILISKNGERLVICHYSYSGGYIWDNKINKLEKMPEKDGYSSNNIVAFSPDGKRVAVNSFQNGLRIWDIEKKVWEQPFSNRRQLLSDSILNTLSMEPPTVSPFGVIYPPNSYQWGFGSPVSLYHLQKQ
jgi:WD40 repeat protein